MDLVIPGSAVRHASVARNVTDYATQPGIALKWLQPIRISVLDKLKYQLFPMFILSTLTGKITLPQPFSHTLANIQRMFREHNLLRLTSIQGMFGICSLFTCILGL